jgi:hypothetical protein
LFHPQKTNLKMAHWLNKKVATLIAFIFAFNAFGQMTTEGTGETDYKDPKGHEKFRKRSHAVGSWQINQLKNGALVVRLKTNKMAIDELMKAGNTKRAEEVRLEQYAINKNTMFAYKDNYTFSKVYFIYSNSSDSLLNGARSGIFLDTNMVVDPSITMNESFYLIAERDYAYNSSIGFVEEDSAKFYIEKGNPVKEMAIILKNKYGHQLKSPFPYFVAEKTFMDGGYDFPIKTVPTSNGNSKIVYVVNKTYLQDLKSAESAGRSAPVSSTRTQTVKVKKHYTYEKLAEYVSELNDNLTRYHRENPSSEEPKGFADARRFFY